MNSKNSAIAHYFERFEPRATLPRFSVLVFRAMLTVSLWFETARSRRHLSALDNDQLRDIGIHPADAAREARCKFYDI